MLLMLQRHSHPWCNLHGVPLQWKVGAPGLLQLTVDVSAAGFGQLHAFPTSAWTRASPNTVNQTPGSSHSSSVAHSKA